MGRLAGAAHDDGDALRLDRMPDWARLRRAVERAIAVVPRLGQRVVDAPLDPTLPHWGPDPTFDLDCHLRRHALGGTQDLAELFREIAPAYETPFDRSRPLWEARVYEGIAGGGAAIFFKLHHAVADGVGGNAIFAAMTDSERDTDEPPVHAVEGKGAWAPESVGHRVADAVRDRVALDLERARTVAGAVVETVRHPSRVPHALTALRDHGRDPLRQPLSGYRDRLFIGIDADETVMPDVEGFERMILDAFAELREGAKHA